MTEFLLICFSAWQAGLSNRFVDSMRDNNYYLLLLPCIVPTFLSFASVNWLRKGIDEEYEACWMKDTCLPLLGNLDLFDLRILFRYIYSIFFLASAKKKKKKFKSLSLLFTSV